MKLPLFFNLALAVVPTALSKPTSPPLPQEPSDIYFLRVVAPNLAYHHRHIVQLTTTGLFGLENFTVHPETPAIQVLPIRIPNRTAFALQLPISSGASPYVAAMLGKTNGTLGTASLGSVFASDPRIIETGNCDDVAMGRQCVGDAWGIYPREAEEEDQGHEGKGIGFLAYDGFLGQWEAVKDAPNSEGWHVYWRALEGGGGDVPEGHRIEIEIARAGQ